ncbi:MAG TPA: NnrU family protein [Burkholderiaceae bacterium]|nr:NnrU family protein [Burkholderiaceae bacterium]HMX11150.1 NnrU family protein [Burkholderiaceae bacterium]HMZ00176.1 NnrU family protein [Burkholderiaceae bacterium]HNB44948.1 NnrU family protein [Burkholderiaceae bacterium]HNG82011.1 NnrU family protein [Burkholderiaceae bacterium]
MATLVLGLLLFLGVHALRIVAPRWREAQRARRGEQRWKGLISLVSAVGLGLIVWGYGQARMAAPADLWLVPLWTRHLAGLLVWPAFVLLAAAYVPGTCIKARVRHPMLLGVKVWALAHLLANARWADLLLFGSFLVWAVLDYRANRQHDRVAAVVYPEGHPGRDGVALLVGSLAWVLFAFWAHAWLIGVAPLG